MNRPRSRTVALAVLLAVSLAGCSVATASPPSGPASGSTAPQLLGSGSSASPSSGTLGADFIGPEVPAPEATVRPSPGSWDAVHPPKGYRIVLLSYGHDAPTTTLARGVRSWAKQEGVALATVDVASPDDLIAAIRRAVAKKPDLVIGVGNAVVDPLSAITPTELEHEFLIVGAELAEPTSNVTAVDWTGAGYRGEGLGVPTTFDASTFTDARAGQAIRAGVAAILNHYTGIVVWLP